MHVEYDIFIDTINLIQTVNKRKVGIFLEIRLFEGNRLNLCFLTIFSSNVLKARRLRIYLWTLYQNLLHLHCIKSASIRFWIQYSTIIKELFTIFFFRKINIT